MNVSRIVTVRYAEFDKTYRTHGEVHNFWELIYADKESIVCTADDREIPLQGGELLFHKPNELHAFAANGKKAPNVLVVCFECKSESMRFFENRKVILDKRYARFLYAILDEAKRTFAIPAADTRLEKLTLLPTPTLGGQQLIKNYLEILLISIMRALTETESGNTTFLQKREYKNHLVDQILEILENNLHRTLTVDEICRQIAYGKAYAFREFKAATGKSIMNYFTVLKIEKAKQLLRENELSVRQIADALAFDTPSYFSKTFKRVTGLTPSAYKKLTLRF